MKYDEDGNPVILDQRCCICHAGDGQTIDKCQGKCEFILTFRDQRGWTYFVRRGLGDHQFKTFYHMPDKRPGVGEHGYRNLPWQETFDQAQEDLNRLAQEKEWEIIQERGIKI